MRVFHGQSNPLRVPRLRPSCLTHPALTIKSSASETYSSGVLDSFGIEESKCFLQYFLRANHERPQPHWDRSHIILSLPRGEQKTQNPPREAQANRADNLARHCLCRSHSTGCNAIGGGVDAYRRGCGSPCGEQKRRVKTCAQLFTCR